MISVIILNWNRRRDTTELLKQLTKQTLKNFETIVVDNASIDNSVPFLKKKFPWAEFIKMDKNLGLFAKNYGLEKARGEYIVLFDSDVLIGNDCLEKFVQKLRDNRDLGMACASVYDAKTKKSLGPNRALKGDNKVGYEVCYFNGSAIAVKREVFKKVGGWSKDYFMCLEELEWAIKILEAGFDIRCFTDIVVYNKKTEGGGSYRSKQGYYYCRNWIWFYLQFLPLREMPNFLSLHLNSFLKKTGRAAKMSKIDCMLGILASFILMPKFLLNRGVVSRVTLERIKADLFPNKKHLYIEQ